ncbi:MAG: AmmeMemoRadiSam system protein B [PVC group bacterium]
MKIRERVLPPGWYPGTAEETRKTIEKYLRDIGGLPPEGEVTGVAGIAPHAGWEFSGRCALAVLRRLRKSVDTIVVVGGHLGPSSGLLAAFEEGYETPLGTIDADLALLEKIGSCCATPLREDRHPDNTVEIQLPFIRHLFPRSRALSLRAAPSPAAVELGKAVKKAADELGRNVAVLGSTDLTHYGSNYGFSPAGRGKEAVAWVKEVNDRGFIGKLLALDAAGAITHAGENQSACSAGGAAAAISFARESGVSRGELISYLTSYDIYPNESFVGYAGIVYSK